MKKKIIVTVIATAATIAGSVFVIFGKRNIPIKLVKHGTVPRNKS